jgi:predicted nucleic acid-binding protein
MPGHPVPCAARPSRRSGRGIELRGIELRDLFIAATAAERGLRLATRNVAHFKGTGLDLVDPFSS